MIEKWTKYTKYDADVFQEITKQVIVGTNDYNRQYNPHKVTYILNVCANKTPN